VPHPDRDQKAQQKQRCSSSKPVNTVQVGFEERGLIATQRGQVTVLNRARLEAVAGDSYGAAEAEYERLIGLPVSQC